MEISLGSLDIRLLVYFSSHYIVLCGWPGLTVEVGRFLPMSYQEKHLFGS